MKTYTQFAIVGQPAGQPQGNADVCFIEGS